LSDQDLSPIPDEAPGLGPSSFWLPIWSLSALSPLANIVDRLPRLLEALAVEVPPVVAFEPSAHPLLSPQREERRYRGDTDVPKSEHSRRVLPLGRLDGLLRKHRPLAWKPDRYVFQRNGEPLDDRDLLRQQIRPAAERLGFYFTGFGWHSFRRQNLTLIQGEGATAIEAQAQAGHSRPVMTSEYTVVGLDRREAAVRRVQERLFGGLIEEEERPHGHSAGFSE